MTFQKYAKIQTELNRKITEKIDEDPEESENTVAEGAVIDPEVEVEPTCKICGKIFKIFIGVKIHTTRAHKRIHLFK